MGRDPDFERVVAEHRPMLMRIVASHEADPERRRDLLQDILLALWRALPGYRGDGELRAFLARVAHNRCVSHVARAVAEPAAAELHDQLAQTADEIEAAERQQRQERLLAAVRRLPLGLRQPVVLTLEGFGPKDIAAILGLNANTVSIRLTRAKAALRSALTGESSDERE